ncbi:LPXTG cell wall anchor domain-containing protein [Enterococcus sp.]|uniref:LPXTG cell wall anchor domain-containing protein n=1 Tax=Enterococcus sp. TaxID=35783 RepID=UPI00290B0B16|nr:LPXTG cell wall anchor domain-containing protein [Enterococcus sp.]MDU5333421.1 LPXTG cell wall anchor domain-containing protein [Enterococcus sp.]
MFRKSVYLFSVALLGVTFVPSSAWADETTEPTTPVVTTELIESPTDVSEQPILESQEPEAENKPELEEAVEEEGLTPENIENNQEGTEQAEMPVAESVEKATSDDAIEKATPQPAVGSTSTMQPVSTKAAVPVLKDDNDGKIVDHEKAITDEQAKIPAEYNFMPNFDHLEDIVVTSAGSYQDRTNYFAFDLSQETPNSITVVYKNVGTYNGKVIDMKVTVKEWTAFSGSLYNQLRIHKKNGITMSGISDVRLNYSFLDNLTASAVNVSGFFNFTDIDLLQSIDLFDHNNVQNFYVTQGNQLYFKTHNGYTKVGEINRKKTNDLDMNHWLTYTYKNVSNFDVRYNQDYDSGAIFNYTYQAPIVIEETPITSEPEKSEVIEELPVQEETSSEKATVTTTKTAEPGKVKTEIMTQRVAEKVQPQNITPAEIKVKEAEPLKQAVLPQTNVQNNSIFALLGSACIVLFIALFKNKKKV